MKRNTIINVSLKVSAVILLLLSLFFMEEVFVAKATADDGIQKVYGKTQFIKQVYEAMLRREEHIVIKYVGKDYLTIFDSFENETFLDAVSAIDDPETSDDFDYLGSNLSYMKTGIKYSKSTEAIFTIQIQWRESLKETQYVNTQITSLIKKLNLKNMNTYEKIKTIHDYIVDNVEYDVDLKNENAYKALSAKSSTCQGYSLLFYKLMTELGIECRYITGTGLNDGENGPHGWNIVKIGAKWYNIDVTWDDPVYVNRPDTKKIAKSYDFFLKGSGGSFDKTHKRDSKYDTKTFNSKYIMSTSDFRKDLYNGNDTNTKSSPLKWNLSDLELNGPDPMFKEVKLSDITSYANIFSNIVIGFDNFVAEEGISGTIKDMWDGFSTVNKLIVIALFVCLFMIFFLKGSNNDEDNNEDDELTTICIDRVKNSSDLK